MDVFPLKKFHLSLSVRNYSRICPEEMDGEEMLLILDVGCCAQRFVNCNGDDLMRSFYGDFEM